MCVGGRGGCCVCERGGMLCVCLGGEDAARVRVCGGRGALVYVSVCVCCMRECVGGMLREVRACVRGQDAV